MVSEWYERAVGSAAAPYLAAYFKHWEQFWTVRIRDSAWFRQGKDLIYLLFNDPQYLDLIGDEEMTEGRRLLESAAAHAETAKQKSRAQWLLGAFEYYEVSVLSYPRTTARITDGQTALSMLSDDAIINRVEIAQKRVKIAESLQLDPILKHPIDIYGCLAYDLRIWSGWNASQFWRLAEYMREREQTGGPVRERVKELFESADSGKMREFSQVLLNAATRVAPLWVYDSESNGQISLADRRNEAGKGNENVNGNGNANAGTEVAAVTLSMSRGIIAGRASYYTPAGTLKGTAEMTLQAQDSQGETVFELRSAKKPLASTAGEWSSLEIVEDVAIVAEISKVTQLRIFIKASLLESGESIVLGDMELY